MIEIIELIKLLEEKSIEEVEKLRDEFIAEHGDSPNHIIERIINAVIEKKRAEQNEA